MSDPTPQETSEQSQVEIAFNDWYRNWTRNICVHDEKNKLLYKAAFFHSWLIQQKRIDELTEALKKIANMDYRGNRSTESQIAYAALSSSKEEKDKKDDGNL